jgi:hypothetical protein
MATTEDTQFSDLLYIPVEGARARRSARTAQAEGQPAGPGDLVWNVLTMLVLLATAVTAMAFFSIYANPYSTINPFTPPGAPTLAAAVVIPTQTPTLEPTLAAATPTFEPTLTFTPTPTLQPTETPTPGPSPTPTIYSLYPFIQRGEIKRIDAASFADHDTCRLWVAGQTYDLQGAPMVGITVKLGGWLDRKLVNQLSLTGTALQYGQAGYEFLVADRPVQSKEAVWVQIFDQSMVPLSGRVYFDTVEDCSENLILVNFRQVK